MTTYYGPPADTEEGIGALTLGGLLAETCARHGEREAIAFPDGDRVVRWTYNDLDHHARAVAKAVLARGLGKGSRVALLMGNRPEWVATAFGVALAGGVLVPINTYFEPSELEHVLVHSDAAMVLTQRELASHHYLDELPSMRAALPYLRDVVALDEWDEFIASGDAVDDDRLDMCAQRVDPSEDALIVYTSGTTALPKGVQHAHRPPTIQSWRFRRHLGVAEDDRVWSAYPFFWTAGFCMVMGATLAAGGCLVLEEQFEPGQALGLLESERVTAAHAWPHQLAALEDHPDWAERDLSSLRHVDEATSFARHPTVMADDSWSPRSGYGLTETFTIVASTPAWLPATEREGHQGHILPGVSIRITDDGEIAVKGPTLMRGYLKTLPEEVFDEDGFFHTGDGGFVDDQGRLHWTGRVSGLIKTGGANVSPVEIEDALLFHPGLKVAKAVGVPDDRLGELVVACVVAHDHATVTEPDVREFLKGKIASYKIPRRVLFFDDDDLSFTGNAKVRTDELRDLAVKRL